MKTVWDKYDKKDLKKVREFCEGYKQFISENKTERECTASAVRMAEEAGYRPLADFSAGQLQPGSKVYAVNRGKNIALFLIGRRPLSEGMNILGAHIDSPRLDLKQHPLYEKDGIALFDTHYYGGIKKYQWVARPMALHGVVCRKDGTMIPVSIGEKDDDPVLGVSDLLVHLAAKQMDKKASEVIDGEDLNVLAGSIPASGKDEDPVKAAVLKLLKTEYGFEEEDFLSAEFEIVPAGKARDFGLDRSMIMGYGHDDRVCAYDSLAAVLALSDEELPPERTSCCILVDKEEIGSVGNTGAQSRFFENTVAELLELCGSASHLDLIRTLKNSRMLSSDVSAAVDPNYEYAFEAKNAAYLGRGICFNKYTGARGKYSSNDANPEFIAQVRSVMDHDGCMFQTAELGAVDVGGGGTIAYILADLDMDVLDAGIAVLNMHSPSEVVSKADVYESWRAYQAFLRNIK
jgi:aspartyl aminopeptidase